MQQHVTTKPVSITANLISRLKPKTKWWCRINVMSVNIDDLQCLNMPCVNVLVFHRTQRRWIWWWRLWQHTGPILTWWVLYLPPICHLKRLSHDVVPSSHNTHAVVYFDSHSLFPAVWVMFVKTSSKLLDCAGLCLLFTASCLREEKCRIFRFIFSSSGD